MERGDGFQIRHNRFVRNDDGIALGPGSDNVITRNHVSRGGDGIRIEKGHGNLIAHNVVAHTHQRASASESTQPDRRRRPQRRPPQPGQGQPQGRVRGPKRRTAIAA